MPVYNERFVVQKAIERVLAVESPRITRLDLIIVDDGSTDGTPRILERLAEKHRDRIQLHCHPRNRGKGAAVRTGLGFATGDVTVIQDADLEYDPRDLEWLILPFLCEDADAVYGSRFTTRQYRRVLYFRHTMGNRLLTWLCNLLTDLNLTDMETGYKAVRTPLLRSIPLRSEDFRIEPELTIKLAKRRARMFEVPINYAGRTYEEGKKIGFRDALLAVGAMVRFALSSDVHVDGRKRRGRIARARLHRALAARIRPWVGSRVLGVGEPMGELARALGPRDLWTIPGEEPLEQECASGRPDVEHSTFDPSASDDFYDRIGAYETVICLNALPRADDARATIGNLRAALCDGGRAILVVPRAPSAPREEETDTYTEDALRSALERDGFRLEALFDFDRAGAAVAWIRARLDRNPRSSAPDPLALAVRLLRPLDPWLPWRGASLVAVASLDPAFGHAATDE